MLFKLFYKRWPLHRQVNFLKRKGILVGSRTREKRKIFLYMYRSIFAEVQFHNDDPDNHAESAKIVSGLKNLNTYLEREFKSNF